MLEGGVLFSSYIIIVKLYLVAPFGFQINVVLMRLLVCALLYIGHIRGFDVVNQNYEGAGDVFSDGRKSSSVRIHTVEDTFSLLIFKVEFLNDEPFNGTISDVHILLYSSAG